MHDNLSSVSRFHVETRSVLRSIAMRFTLFRRVIWA